MFHLTEICDVFETCEKNYQLTLAAGSCKYRGRNRPALSFHCFVGSHRVVGVEGLTGGLLCDIRRGFVVGRLMMHLFL